MTAGSPHPRPQALLRWPSFVMGQLHRAAVGRMDEALAEVGLSLRDYYVLACIAEGGELAQQQVADRIGMDRSDLVKVLDRLEAAGWIDRQRDRADRRRHVLTLTDGGRAAVAKTEEICQAVTDDLLAPLTGPDQQTLHHLLLKAFGQPYTSPGTP